MRFLKIAAVICPLLFAGCQSYYIQDTLTQRNETVRLKSSLANPYGVNQLIQHEKAGLPEYQLTLTMTGAGWDRIIFPWDAIEPEFSETQKGQWEYTNSLLDRAHQLGLKVLPVLSRTPSWATVEIARCNDFARKPNIVHWRRFVARTVAKYPEIQFWQLWETPDNFDTFEGIPNDYVELLKAGYLSARQANPDCIILMGSMSNPNWLDTALGFGAGRYCDIIALHLTATVSNFGITGADAQVEKDGTAEYETGTEIKTLHLRSATSDEDEILSAVLGQLDELLAVLERHKINKPVWITSIGDFAAPAHAQARLLTKLHAGARARSVHGIFWHEFVSSVDGNVASGLLFPDVTRRPAADAYAAATAMLANTQFTRNISEPEGVKAYEFTGYDRVVTVAWAQEDETLLKLPLSYRGIFNHLGQPRLLLQEEKDNSEITIGREPIYIISDIVPVEPPAQPHDLHEKLQQAAQRTCVHPGCNFQPACFEVRQQTFGFLKRSKAAVDFVNGANGSTISPACGKRHRIRQTRPPAGCRCKSVKQCRTPPDNITAAFYFIREVNLPILQVIDNLVSLTDAR